MSPNYTLWERAKPWFVFAFWMSVDLAMVLWSGNKTHWGKSVWMGMFSD